MKKEKIFNPVSPQVNFPQIEEEILKFWDKNNTFQKSLEKTKDGQRFVFYEGPPTANGKPHIGHVITRIFKDVFPRFKTMQGYHVVRKGGWDTHGLPVEVEVEKELGISGKEEIENIVPGDKTASIIKFNELCKKNVWKYIDLWEKMVKRVGHWIDLKDAYVTYHKTYIESVWWSLKELYQKGLLYLGYKVVPYCTRCETPLSSHEVVQDYKETEDPSVFVKFPLLGEKDTYFLVWTTTPWTLPGNVGLAVDEKLTYVKVKSEKEHLILLREAAERMGFKDVIEKIQGSDLIGKNYKPLFSFLSEKFPDNKNLHTVVPGDFIKTEEGTGIVHTAVMYGEEDFELGKEYGLPMHHLVDIKGRFTKDANDYASLYIKDADKVIIKDLLEEGLIYKVETILHQYPFCWRCHTPLIYYALESWFIKTTDVKQELIRNNDLVNWVPKHIKKGRMKNWYETLIDWSLSRNRYWGTPLPIWDCKKCGEKIALGSFAELKEKAKNKDINWDEFDLHRPWVDDIILECTKCQSETKRVPYVIDVWYDSGCMPFAQFNYPMGNKEVFKNQFPANYITEAIDQTRGWFYSLQAVSTMLFGKTPYKSVVVFSHALDEEGKKMSKHLGNVLDPWLPLEKYGADVTRWFFFSSVPIGAQYRVSMDTISDALKSFILIYWNTYNFFITNSLIDEIVPSFNLKSENVLDKWILSKLQVVIVDVTEGLEKYDTFAASKALEYFIVEDFSKWYVRRSRERMGPTAENNGDKHMAYDTYYSVLLTVTKLLAPFMPFITENIFKNITDEESVHLTDWPVIDKALINKDLEEEMKLARSLVEEALSFRKKNEIKVRLPFKEMEYKGPKELAKDVEKVVLDEINVYSVSYKGRDIEFSVNADTGKANLDLKMGEARDLIRAIQGERKKLKTKMNEKVNAFLPKWPIEYEEFIKRKALIDKLEKGPDFKVVRNE